MPEVVHIPSRALEVEKPIVLVFGRQRRTEVEAARAAIEAHRPRVRLGPVQEEELHYVGIYGGQTRLCARANYIILNDVNTGIGSRRSNESVPGTIWIAHSAVDGGTE